MVATHSWWIQQRWPSLRNEREMFGGLGAGLGILGQAEFHLLEKDYLKQVV